MGMRAVAVGGKAFVYAFRLAGIGGLVAESARDALREVYRLVEEQNIGVILVSDEYGSEFVEKIRQLSSSTSRPVIYLLPRPGSRPERVEYRAILRRVLGI